MLASISWIMAPCLNRLRSPVDATHFYSVSLQQRPLTSGALLEHAERQHGDTDDSTLAN